MAHQIVKQPDGKFAIWSTVVDDFVVVDCENANEVIEEFVADARQSITESVNRTIGQLDRGERPYNQFTKTYEECIALRNDIHGEDADE